MAKVVVDEAACVGCGLCINACSEVFELNEGGIAKVKAQECSSCDLHEVASQCPVNCISVES